MKKREVVGAPTSPVVVADNDVSLFSVVISAAVVDVTSAVVVAPLVVLGSTVVVPDNVVASFVDNCTTVESWLVVVAATLAVG